MLDLYSNPFGETEPSVEPADQQAPKTQEDLSELIDKYQREGYTIQQIINSATMSGFSQEAVEGEMYNRIEDAKQRQEADFDAYLTRLREAKQEQVNARAAKNAMAKVDPDVLIEADRSLLNANSTLSQLRQYKKDVESGTLTPGEINVRERFLEELGEDPVGLREDTEKTGFAPGLTASSGLQNMIMGWMTNTMGERSQEQTDELISAINNRILVEEENLARAVSRQNEINASVGLSTAFDPMSEFDVRKLTQESVDRLGLEEAFEKGKEDYSNVDYVPGVTQAVGYVAQWAAQSASDIARFANAVTANNPGINAWLDRADANISGFNAEMASSIGLSEQNQQRDFTEVLFSDESIGQKIAKTTDFTFKLLPEAAAQIYTLGAAGGAKTGAKGLMKYATPSNMYLTSLGLKSAGSFRKSIDDREDLTNSEKNLMSLMVGGSELALASMFRGAERLAGKAFVPTPKSVAQEARRRGTAALKDIDYGRIGWKEAGKQTIFEGFEEGIQSVVQENIENVYDYSRGVTPRKDVNWYAIADGFVGGLIMGGTMAGVGKLASNLGHSKVKESIEQQKKVVEYLRTQIEREPNVEKRQQLKATLLQEQDRLMRLHSVGNAFYDRMSEQDKNQIIGLNQKLSDLRDRAQAAKGKERDQLISEFESLYGEKSAIESKYITEEELSELSKERPSTNQLLNLIEEVTEERTLSPEEAAQAENSAKEEDDAVSFTNEEVANEVYSLLEAADEAKKRGDVRTYGKLRQQARRIANASGIDGMDWVDVLDKYEKGQRVAFPEPGQPRPEGSEFVQDSVEMDLTPDGNIEQGGNNTSVPSRVISKLNTLVRGFSKRFASGKVKAVYHKTQNSLYSISDEMRQAGAQELKNPENGVTFGLWVPDGRGGGTLHIGPNFDVKGQDVVSEEVLHFVLEPLLREDDVARQRLFDELLDMAGIDLVDGKFVAREGATFNPAARAVIMGREPFYDPADLAEFQEEIIMGFLLDYARQPAAYRVPDNRSALERIVENFKNLFSRGGKVEGNTISNADDLLSLAEKVSRGMKGEQTEIMGRHNKDLEGTRRARGNFKKPFNYLKDTEIFYRVNDYARAGFTFDKGQGSWRSIKVNDYFHFRNWYNKATGNQRLTERIAQMYYVDKNGVQRTIKRPKPKVDRNGELVYMPLPKSGFDRQKERYDRNAKIAALRAELNFRLGTLGYQNLPDDLMDKFAKEMEEETNEKIRKLLGIETNEPVEGGDSVRDLDETPPKTDGDTETRKAKGELIPSDEDIISDFNSRREKSYGRKESDKTLVSSMVSVNVEELPYEVASISDLQDAPWMMVSYDALGAATINIYGKEYKLDSGVADVFKTKQAGGTLSLSHADNSKRKSTLTALRKLKENGHSRVHVFVNTNNAENAFKNPKLFSTMVNSLMDRIFDKSVLEGKGQYKPSMNQAQARQMMVDGLTQVKFRGKTGLDLIVNSKYYKSLTDAQKRELGMNPETNQFASAKGRTVEQIRSLYDILLLNPEGVNQDHQKDLTSFDFREKLASKLELLDRSGKRRKFGKNKTHTIDIGTLSDLEYQALAIDPSMKTTDENGNTTPFDAGTVGFVMTINIDEALSDSGQFEDFTKAFPFQIGGLEGLFKLDNNYTVQALLGVSPSQAAQLIMTREFEPTEDVEARRQEFISKERERLMKEFEEKMASAERATTDVSSQRRARGIVKDNVKSDPSTWTLGEKSASQNYLSLFKQKIVDKYQRILDLQSEVEQSRGFATRKDEDFKMAEELMYGKAAEDLNKLEQRVDAIVEMMKQEELTQKEVNDFLYALHVEERNRVIFERNGKTDGSGKSSEWAAETLERLAPKRESLESVVELIREIQDDTRKTYVETGAETQEAIDAFEAMFSDYVPLAGLSVDENNTQRSPYPTSASLSITDPSTRRAEGRQSEAENIFAQIISQNAQAHINGRTNEAMNALYNLVVNNPNPNVWSIVEEASPNDAHVVGVRVNGEQKFIRFADASYAETLRGMGVAKTNLFLKIISVPNNWLRMSFTTLNPEFVISNFSRDIQSAIFNAAAEADIEGGMLEEQGIVKDILANSVPALKALLKGVVGKDMPPVIERYYQDFKDDGGKTGWAYTKSLQDYAAQIDKAVAKNGTTPAQQILGSVRKFGQAVESINDAFENSIRLSAYIAARENGVSREKAAQLAKNITVNFNKHGEYGQVLNSIYLFFNASVQGTARLGRSLLSAKPATRPDGSKREWYERMNNAQKMAAGYALFNAMITMLNRALSDEDEDGTLFYDKIPDYVKERNMIFMFDGKNYITIPMPYGFNIFANVGSASVDVSQGGRDADEALIFLGSSFMSSFIPLGFGQSRDLYTHTVKAFTPTVFKPIVEINNNETHFGGQIFMEPLPYGTPKPDSHMAFSSPKAVQEFFQWVNQASGGTGERPGSLDANPDKAWYLFQYFLGGAGQFVTRAGETTFKIASKVENPDIQLAFNDIPLLRKLYGEPSKYYDFQLFKDNADMVKQLSREMKNKDERIDEPGFYNGVAKLNELLNNYNSRLKVLRKQRKEAQKIDDYTERTIKVQGIRDKERALVMKFNETYERLRGQED